VGAAFLVTTERVTNPPLSAAMANAAMQRTFPKALSGQPPRPFIVAARKSRSIEEVIAQSELLEQCVRGYGEALSNVRRTQQGSHGWAFAIVAVLAWRLLRGKSRRPKRRRSRW
jgi:hypothetical protein